MASPRKPTIAEAIFQNTLAIRKSLQPLLADEKETPTGQGPIETLLSVQEATLESIRQVQAGQEKIIGLLSQPVLKKAIDDLLKD
jgi:hypothetical protein